MRALRIILLSLTSIAATVSACGVYLDTALSRGLGFDHQLTLMVTLTLAAVALWATAEAIQTLRNRHATAASR